MQDWSRWRDEDHGRSLLITNVDIDGTPLQTLNLHGVWTANKRGDERAVRECEYIVEAAKRANIATIITGDFNLIPDTPSIEIINKEYCNLITEYGVTSTRPVFKDELEEGDEVIDYMFVNDLVDVHSFEVVNSDVSDHLLLVLGCSIRASR